jgi:hypothetical protein
LKRKITIILVFLNKIKLSYQIPFPHLNSYFLFYYKILLKDLWLHRNSYLSLNLFISPYFLVVAFDLIWRPRPNQFWLLFPWQIFSILKDFLIFHFFFFWPTSCIVYFFHNYFVIVVQLFSYLNTFLELFDGYYIVSKYVQI